jgi:hypothetical protein
MVDAYMKVVEGVLGAAPVAGGRLTTVEAGS